MHGLFSIESPNRVRTYLRENLPSATPPTAARSAGYAGKASLTRCALLFFILTSSVFAQDLDQTLRKWVDANIFFTNPPTGKRALFIRKTPIRADFRLDIPSIIVEAKLAVTSFATSFGVDFEFTSERPNLIVAIANEIN